MSLRSVVIALLFAVGLGGVIGSTDSDYYSTCAAEALDDECAAACEQVVVDLAARRTHVVATHGLCISLGPAPSTCGCFVDEPEPRQPIFGDDDVRLVGCSVESRLGECLLDVDGAGCDGATVGPCDDVCAAREAALVEVDQPLDARLVRSTCDDHCVCTVEVDGRCALTRFSATTASALFPTRTFEVGDRSCEGGVGEP